jgi:hypothetical protein
MIKPNFHPTTYQVPEAVCATCGNKSNACVKLASEVEEGQPEPTAPFPGGWVVCQSCGEIFVHNEDLELECPSPAMFGRLTEEQADFLIKVQATIRNKNN